MKLWRAACLMSLGGLVEAQNVASNSAIDDKHSWLPLWAIMTGLCACGWAWSAVGEGLRNAATRLLHAVAGRPQPLPKTDPQALAAEVARLNRQIATLRDTATSFDMSFDETLQRMDERLHRVEQQSAYIQPPTQKAGG